jgi:hypothetical protein
MTLDSGVEVPSFKMFPSAGTRGGVAQPGSASEPDSHSVDSKYMYLDARVDPHPCGSTLLIAVEGGWRVANIKAVA